MAYGDSLVGPGKSTQAQNPSENTPKASEDIPYTYYICKSPQITQTMQIT